MHTAVFKVDREQGPTYSTGTSALYNVTTKMGTECEKGRDTPMCIAEILC